MSNSSKINGNLFGFKYWAGCVIILTLIFAIIFTAWAVRHALTDGRRFTVAQNDVFLALAKFPTQANMAVDQVISSLGGSPSPMLIKKSEVDQTYWNRHFPEPEDEGYLLFSGIDRGDHKSSVSLLRVSDGKQIARWMPDWVEILENSSGNMYSDEVFSANAMPTNPILMPNADLIFNTSISMVRVTLCGGKPVWVLNDVAHHSNELDNDGNIQSLSVSTDGYEDIKWLRNRVRDDAIIKVSPDGKVLQKISFAKIMRENGLEALLLGTQGFNLQTDPVHLNQISIAKESTKFWKKDDLLVSARNLSTLFLYRPSTGRIIWHKTGPWMNQHSAKFFGNHQISIYDNHVISGPNNNGSFINDNFMNKILVYDFLDGKITEPFSKLLSNAKPRTWSGGLAQLLSDGGLFIEENNYGRHMRFTRDRLLWTRVNDYDEKRIGLVSWSRYLTAEEVLEPLKSIASNGCN